MSIESQRKWHLPHVVLSKRLSNNNNNAAMLLRSFLQMMIWWEHSYTNCSTIPIHQSMRDRRLTDSRITTYPPPQPTNQPTMRFRRFYTMLYRSER